MNGRLKILGVMLAVVGLVFIAGGGYRLLQDEPGSPVAAGVQRRAERQPHLQRSRSVRRPGRDRRRRRRSWPCWPTTGITRSIPRSSTRTTRWSTRPVSTCTRWPRSPTTPSTATTTVVLDKDVEYKGQVYQGRHVRVRERRPILDRLRPGEPDRGSRPRADLDRHGAWPDRRAWRR